MAEETNLKSNGLWQGRERLRGGALRERKVRNSRPSRGNMLAVKQALVAAGLYEIPEWGVTPNPDENIFPGLAALQSREGLSDPAGEARPGDETDHALAQYGSGADGSVHVSAYAQDRDETARPYACACLARIWWRSAPPTARSGWSKSSAHIAACRCGWGATRTTASAVCSTAGNTIATVNASIR